MTSTTKPAVTSDVRVEVRHGEAYEIDIRGHLLLVDQPQEVGGTDTAPTPTELFVASLASCVAFYAGRWLTRHGFSRRGLAVDARYRLATDRPARVAAIDVTLHVPPEVPPALRPALRAVAMHCTVHNSIANPPDIEVVLR